MKAGFTQINGGIVGVNDGRLAEYADSVQTERSFYDIKTARGLSTDLALAHVDKLKVIDETLTMSFSDPTKTTPNLKAQILDMTLVSDMPSAHAFNRSYIYSRATRIMTAEYGPDASAGFKLVHSVALHEADELLAESRLKRTPEIVDWDFSRLLRANTIDTLLRTEPYRDTVGTLVKEQVQVLQAFQEQLNEIGTLHQVCDPDLDESYDQAVEATNEEGVVFDIDFPTKIDVAVVKLVTWLKRMDPAIYKSFGPNDVQVITTTGKLALSQRHLFSSPEYKSFIEGQVVLDFSKAACKPDTSEDLYLESFFPSRGRDNKIAKSLCAKCPIQPDCLEAAIRSGVKHGFWGGESERSRRKIRRARIAAGLLVDTDLADEPEETTLADN